MSAHATDAAEHSGIDEVRLFKRSIIAWTLRVAALLLVVGAVIGRKEIILGFVFGLCIGLANFDLMTRFNAALMRSGSRGGRVAIGGTLVRMALIFGGAAAVHYKGWNLIAAGVGCFLVYPVLYAHGWLMGHHSPTPPVDAGT